MQTMYFEQNTYGSQKWNILLRAIKTVEAKIKTITLRTCSALKQKTRQARMDLRISARFRDQFLMSILFSTTDNE